MWTQRTSYACKPEDLSSCKYYVNLRFGRTWLLLVFRLLDSYCVNLLFNSLHEFVKIKKITDLYVVDALISKSIFCWQIFPFIRCSSEASKYNFQYLLFPSAPDPCKKVEPFKRKWDDFQNNNVGQTHWCKILWKIFWNQEISFQLPL